MLGEALDHVKFMNLFGIVFGLGVVLRAALFLLLLHLLQQLPSAVIEGQDLVGHMGRPHGLRRAGEPQLAQDLPSDGLYPLLLDVVQVQGGAGGQREAHGSEAQQGEQYQSPLHVHLHM